ncbi:unnamed protein product [Orchesella dallaii]|uniref:Uncharacterized protein n=1 Tax=Orchesella dallaii TaxID=48710 RepID=A0ABP1Q4W7_9HEXA
MECPQQEFTGLRAICLFDMPSNQVFGKTLLSSKPETVSFFQVSQLKAKIMPSFIALKCLKCVIIPKHITKLLKIRLTNPNPKVTLEYLLMQVLFPNCTVSERSEYFLPFFRYAHAIIHGGIKSPQLTVEADWYHFVTCANVMERGRLSFWGYVSAFDQTIWILLIVSILISSLYFRCTLKKMKKCVAGMSLPLCMLLEQGTKIAHMQNIRLVAALWMLTGIVFTNSYKGENITKLTSPIDNYKLDSFEKLVGATQSFAFYSNNLMSQMFNDLINSPENLKSILSQGTAEGKEMLSRIYSSDFDVTFMSNQSDADWNIVKKINATMKRPTTIQELVEMEAPSYLLNKIAKCKFDAYIGSYEKVLSMFVTIKSKLEGRENEWFVSMSKKPLGGSKKSWEFRYIDASAVEFEKRVHSLAQSHIVEWWTGRIQWITQWNYTVKVNRIPKEPWNCEVHLGIFTPMQYAVDLIDPWYKPESWDRDHPQFVKNYRQIIPSSIPSVNINILLNDNLSEWTDNGITAKWIQKSVFPIELLDHLYPGSNMRSKLDIANEIHILLLTSSNCKSRTKYCSLCNITKILAIKPNFGGLTISVEFESGVLNSLSQTDRKLSDLSYIFHSNLTNLFFPTRQEQLAIHPVAQQHGDGTFQLYLEMCSSQKSLLQLRGNPDMEDRFSLVLLISCNQLFKIIPTFIHKHTVQVAKMAYVPEQVT